VVVKPPWVVFKTYKLFYGWSFNLKFSVPRRGDYALAKTLRIWGMVNNKQLAILVEFKALFSVNGKGLKQTVGSSTRRIKSFAQKARLKPDSKERRQLPYFLCHSFPEIFFQPSPSLWICLNMFATGFFSLSSNQVELFTKRKL